MLGALVAALIAAGLGFAVPPQPVAFPAGTLRDLPSPRDDRLEEVPRVPPPATVRDV
ncbi:hypothetical protein [Elioraea sp.]|uniref:hypothetical protein n=1 Tax=Elioraea sp. TaxID=2185103 RepID=UPI003F72F3DE